MIPPNIVAAAQASHKAFYPLGPYPSFSIAQFGIESNWGKVLSGKNNPFGIKATPEQIAAGQATIRWTHEYINGRYEVVQQYFADYDSIDDAFYLHAKLLAESPIYVEAQHASNLPDYIVAVAKHYATAPNYASVISNIIAQSNLTQYDTEVTNA